MPDVDLADELAELTRQLRAPAGPPHGGRRVGGARWSDRAPGRRAGRYAGRRSRGRGIDTDRDRRPAGARSLRSATELGECTRCKLHATRKSIVFGVGDPRRAADVRRRGARASRRTSAASRSSGPPGELLDKMIEAMGWSRELGLHQQHRHVPAAAATATRSPTRSRRASRSSRRGSARSRRGSSSRSAGRRRTRCSAPTHRSARCAASSTTATA